MINETSASFPKVRRGSKVILKLALNSAAGCIYSTTLVNIFALLNRQEERVNTAPEVTWSLFSEEVV